jgi:peptidoglycan/LPS O-acetylase OafA/YrhL
MALGETPFWFLLISLALCFWGAHSLKRLMKDWEKGGFWHFCVVTLALQIITIIFAPGTTTFGSLIGSIIMLGITYGVLRLHNAFNAKTTWEQLS